MSVRITSLLFLLGEEAVPPAQGGIQILGAVPSLLRTMVTGFAIHVAHCSFWKRSLWYSSYWLMGVRALPCGLDYVQFPLRLSCGDGFSDVLTGVWAPRFGQPLFPSRRLKSTVMWSFLGELSGNVPVFCDIWYDSGYSLRQCTVSVWQQRQVRTVQTVPGPARGYPTGVQFLDKFDVPVVFWDRYVQCCCVQTLEIPQVPFLVLLLTCPLLCMSRSSTSPSWRRSRFPWFSELIMRFPCCSPLIRWSISWLCRSWGAGREELVEIPQ